MFANIQPLDEVAVLQFFSYCPVNECACKVSFVCSSAKPEAKVDSFHPFYSSLLHIIKFGTSAVSLANSLCLQALNKPPSCHHASPTVQCVRGRCHGCGQQDNAESRGAPSIPTI